MMIRKLKLFTGFLLVLFGVLLVGCVGLGRVPAPTPTPIPLSPEELADSFQYEWREIAFDDLIQSRLHVELSQCWNGMGMDDK